MRYPSNDLSLAFASGPILLTVLPFVQSTGVTSDGKLSSFQHSSAENGAALIPLHHEAASDLDADGSESDVASSTVGSRAQASTPSQPA